MIQRAKMRFLAIFLSSVHRIGLILHILIELNGLHALASVSLMLDVSKTIESLSLDVKNMYVCLSCWSVRPFSFLQFPFKIDFQAAS